ncbi:hypothetical protein ERHA55_27620 [Erwinia rhapontici]|nr:hypothetical protein ERHA55_27620 [Erwinia rhapontici]
MNTLFFINLHKALVIPVIIFLMWFYQNDSMTAYIYLALHGTYSVLWLVKEATFPDQRFARQIPPAWAGWLFIFVLWRLIMPRRICSSAVMLSRHRGWFAWCWHSTLRVFIYTMSVMHRSFIR